MDGSLSKGIKRGELRKFSHEACGASPKCKLLFPKTKDRGKEELRDTHKTDCRFFLF